MADQKQDDSSKGSVYEKRVRDLEQLTGTLRKRLTYAPFTPRAPRGVQISTGLLTWEPPKELRNVSHYNIYCPDERTLIHRAPKGQTSWSSALLVDSALVSSFNELTEKESRKIPASPAE